MHTRAAYFIRLVTDGYSDQLKPQFLNRTYSLLSGHPLYTLFGEAGDSNSGAKPSTSKQGGRRDIQEPRL